jgi:peptide/nickel transport system ATP-binding protein
LGLLKSIPRLDEPRKEKLVPIEGLPPDLVDPPQGCPFQPRCPRVFDRCRVERPDLLPAGQTRAACWLHAPAQENAEKAA